MKKLFSILGLLLAGFTANAQQVSDMAVIPIGVTLNSIMRLTVTSGGNIEFVVNTMQQYEEGVPNATPYTTTFDVSSSSDFYVTLAADNENMIGTVNNTHVMPVDFLAYEVVAPSSSSLSTIGNGHLSNTETAIVGDSGSAVEGGSYTGIQIKWSLESETTGTSSAKLLGLPSDRYTVNAYLQLKAANN
ncbi:MAG: hypothetical protein IKQ46_11970 [Bacteroidales bacterium]|nr:hypothetical protein [Bacteroidales bacterium]